MYYFSTIYLIIFFLIKVSVFEFKTTNILILSHGPCLLEGKSAHILGNVSFFLLLLFFFVYFTVHCHTLQDDCEIVQCLYSQVQ